MSIFIKHIYILKSLYIKEWMFSCASFSALQTTYDVPDQVDSVITERSGQQNSQVHIIKSESQIKDSLSVSVGIGVETGKVGFSASTSYSKMQVRD